MAGCAQAKVAAPAAGQGISFSSGSPSVAAILIQVFQGRRCRDPGAISVNQSAPRHGHQPCFSILRASLSRPAYERCFKRFLQRVFGRGHIARLRSQKSHQPGAAPLGDLRHRVDAIVFCMIRHHSGLAAQLFLPALRGADSLSSSFTVTVSPGPFPIASRISAFTGNL